MRQKADRRKAAILQAAMQIAERTGYLNMTRSEIARQANVSVGLVNRYYVTMARLRNAVMHEAIRREIAPIIAQGLASGCPIAMEAPHSVRVKAAIHIAG